MYTLSRREEEILLTIWNMKDNAYLVGIRNQINSLTGKELTIGAIHIPLTKLEQEGIVTSHMGEATSKRGGRRKRIYNITDNGIEVLKEYRRKQDVFWGNFNKEFSL
ncbi:MAG: PadR family transcriptional regulator [bacterium]|nr:PadR family transcriptional regulator [bacterium]